MFQKQLIGKKKHSRGIGRIILAILIILFAAGAFAMYYQPQNNTETANANTNISKPAPECYEFDFRPSPEKSRVLERANQIVQASGIKDARKIKPETELKIVDGQKTIITSLGDEGQEGPWGIAWDYERSKLPLRHGIWCK
ncbi:MAG TPA: hypothetical protein VK255_04480 [Patescibacteria group bacterium]|nr:hypothetical protein [Patescibacteria group bacterium]